MNEDDFVQDPDRAWRMADDPWPWHLRPVSFGSVRWLVVPVEPEHSADAGLEAGA